MNAPGDDIFAQLEGAVAQWSAQLEETEGQLRAAVATPDPSGHATEALQRQVQALRETLESLQVAIEAKRALEEEGAESPVSGEGDELAARCAQLEAELEAVRRERDHLKTAMEARAAEMESGLAAFDHEGHRRRIGEILQSAGLISEKHLSEALREQRWTQRRRLGEILIERGLASEVLVAVIIARQLRLPFVSLEDVAIPEDITRRVPAKVAARHTVIPLREEAGHLVVAMANPLDLIAIDDIERACGSPVRPVVAAPAAIRARLAFFFDLGET